jgi:beta-fructofuranosidase
VRFHHRPPAGWVNDPYGLTWHGGRWHLFFQHVPGSTTWRPDCHWGHATSTDLLTWEQQPVALAPGRDAAGHGEDGCWSGSVAGGVAFYTAVDEAALDLGRVRRALPLDDDWRTWRKEDVVVTAPPEATHFRDPFVHRHGDHWRMLVGGATADAATVWAFTSEDLHAWEPAGVLAERSPEADGEWTGHAWECPQWWSIDGHEVLLVSVWEPERLHHLAYRVDDGPWRRLSSGLHYAGSAFTHRDGRPGLVTWLREVGATSLPMTLTLEGDRLVAHPPAGVPVVERDGRLEVHDDGVVERFGPDGIEAPTVPAR